MPDQRLNSIATTSTRRDAADASAAPCMRSAVVAEVKLHCERPRDASDLMQETPACMLVHDVDVERVLISRDGRRALVIFRAPDAEAVRQACRHARLDCERIWTSVD